jgi:CheY-like chemotaxis protein
LRLPLAGQVTNDAQKAEPIAEPRRVLVVDDNQDAADSMAMLLRFEGHQVEIAYSAEEALGLLGRFDPQVALLDIGLPGMDGYELARRIRKAGFEELHLIALSGYGQREDRARSQEAGFDAHLIKPIEIDILKGVLAAGRGVAAPDMHQGELPI